MDLTHAIFASFENLEKLKEEYAPQKKWQVWYQDNNFVSKLYFYCCFNG